MCWPRTRRPRAGTPEELLELAGHGRQAPCRHGLCVAAGLRAGQVFSNCLVHPEVVDSLTRPNASFASQRLPYRSGMTIPGRILATDYDMGANGVAYNDTVYDDEAGNGPGGVAGTMRGMAGTTVWIRRLRGCQHAAEGRMD